MKRKRDDVVRVDSGGKERGKEEKKGKKRLGKKCFGKGKRNKERGV